MNQDPILWNDWHPVYRGDALIQGKPQSVRLLGDDHVVWRSVDGVHAWKDLCVHRGTRLSLGKAFQDTLTCPYHGWVYDVSGQCIHIPAQPEQKPPPKAHAVVYQAREKYGMIWVCLGEPVQDIPSFPEESDPSFRKMLTGPFPPMHASGLRAIENFLDVTHFPFVHSGILGDANQPQISDYQVETDGLGLVAHDILAYQPDPYGTGSGETVRYTYRVIRPLTAYLAKEAPDGSQLSLMLTLTPHEEFLTSAWFYGAINDKIKIEVRAWDDFQRQIFSQDVPIVESQRPELLPLDLQAELHLRSDRLAIAYRRWLRELGISYGVI